MKNFRQQQRPKKSSLVIGRTKVIAALQAGQQLDRIYLDTRAQGQEISEIKRLASQQAIRVNYVPVAKLNGFNITDHEGVVAQIAKVQYQQLQDVISLVTESGKAPLFLILDGITDIHNIGGIARTAFCTGVDAIIIPDKGVGALNEDAILPSAGALEKIAVCRVNSLMKAVDELHLNGIKVFASEMTAEQTINKTDFTEPCAIGKPETKAPSALTVVVQQWSGGDPVAERLAKPIVYPAKYPVLYHDTDLKETVKAAIVAELAQELLVAENGRTPDAAGDSGDSGN